MLQLRYSLALIACLLLTVPAMAQPASATEGWPEADSADVGSIDAIIHALYETISGPAGQKRDWDRLRSLHHPDARLIPIVKNQQGDVFPLIWTVEQYIERAGATLEQRGFFEIEIGRKTETYGYMTHLTSTYESRWTEEDEEPFDRGINSFQLLHDGSRWWIVNVYWNSERTTGIPIPAMYGG
ncbi:MAG: hypothetical protein RhofKO_02800 [Rhodothermales bacterium]